MIKRRSVLQILALSPIAFVVPRISFAAGPNAAAAGAPANALSEAEPLSKAMRYVADASKAGPERADKKAICHTCAKWNQCAAKELDPTCKSVDKNAPYAPCSIFAAKVVAKNGWCMSWAKA